MSMRIGHILNKPPNVFDGNSDLFEQKFGLFELKFGQFCKQERRLWRRRIGRMHIFYFCSIVHENENEIRKGDLRRKQVTKLRGAAIAQCLPSCCPGFKFQAFHLRFYHLPSNLSYWWDVYYPGQKDVTNYRYNDNRDPPQYHVFSWLSFRLCSVQFLFFNRKLFPFLEIEPGGSSVVNAST